MTANLYVQDWAESRILVDINLLYESLFRSEVLCILGINAATLVLFSVSRVQKYCPFSTNFKPASEHSMDG